MPTLQNLCRKQPLGMLGGSLLIILVCLAVSAPLLMPFDPYEPHVLYKYANPGTIYTETGQRWLGADQLGRDTMTTPGLWRPHFFIRESDQRQHWRDALGH